MVDAKGQRIEYDYDARNLMTQVRYYAPGDLSTPVKTVDFTYDDLGNLKTYADDTTTGTYIYDDLSQKIAETIDYGAFTKTIGYDYYANGLKKSFTGPDAEAVNYSYDEGNRLSAITIPGIGQITTNAYHWNAPARVTLPGGSTTDYTYDPLMRMKTICLGVAPSYPIATTYIFIYVIGVCRVYYAFFGAKNDHIEKSQE